MALIPPLSGVQSIATAMIPEISASSSGTVFDDQRLFSQNRREMHDLLREQRYHTLQFLQCLMRETLRWNVFMDQDMQYEQYMMQVARKSTYSNQTKSDSAAIIAALQRERPDDMCYHLESGPDLHLNHTLDCYPMGTNALLLAIENESLPYAMMLIDIGSNVEHSDEFGETPLIKAAKKDNLELVQLLLDQGGADVNATNMIKETALMFACRRGCLSIVSHLLARGADHSMKNEEGETCLHMACKFLRVQVVQSLLAFGADKTVRNNSYATPKDQIEFQLVMDDTPKVREIHRLLSR